MRLVSSDNVVGKSEETRILNNRLLLVCTAINVVLGLKLTSADCNLRFPRRSPRRRQSSGRNSVLTGS